jgi:IS30 family transposase
LPNYRRLTYQDRCHIDALLIVGKTRSEIAQRTGFNKSTISRELRRNFVGTNYHPKSASALAKERFKSCQKKPIINGTLALKLEAKLILGWTPEQISGRFQNEKIATFSHETIYRYIRRNKHLKRHLKFFNKRGAGRYFYRGLKDDSKKRIKERPQIVNKRGRVGDWERDTIFCANQHKALVCVDRKSRLTKLVKLQKPTTAAHVAQKTVDILSNLGRKVFSITSDNGTELGDQSLKYQMYYCDPYKPQQRGTVENTNGLIRKYIKTTTKLELMSDLQIQEIEDLINHRPRKCLDYKTPYEVFYRTRVALVS